MYQVAYPFRVLVIYRRHQKGCKSRSRSARSCKCAIWVQGSLGGETVRRSLNQTSWDRASRIIAEWIDSGEIGGRVRQAPLVEEAIQKYLEDAKARNLRPQSVELMEQIVKKHFGGWCEDKGYTRFSQLTPERLRDFREGWTLAPSTTLTRMERLRGFFRFCVDSGWIKMSPMKGIKLPIVRPHEVIRYFTEKEMAAILGACDKLITHGRYSTAANRMRVKAFILVLRYTGLRISDAAKLSVSQVADGKITLRTGKYATMVAVPVPPVVIGTLAEVPRHGEYYFQTGKANEKTVRGTWDRTLRTILKLAGVKKGSAHVFRHTLVNNLLKEGVPLETVAAILGNSPAILMKHYSHWIRERQVAMEEAVRRTWATSCA